MATTELSNTAPKHKGHDFDSVALEVVDDDMDRIALRRIVLNLKIHFFEPNKLEPNEPAWRDRGF